MATKSNGALVYSFDVGNGKCAARSSDNRETVQFEPTIAPLTTKRGLEKSEEKPKFSLRVDGQTLVFGIDDVFEHGKRDAIRRLNSSERYTTPDYFSLIDVLFLHAFAGRRGQPEYISPTGIISVPVDVFNNEATLEEIRSTLIGKRILIDYDGCELRLDIKAERLAIQPESTGALMHWVFDPDTLKQRKSPTGTTLVIDLGYETAHCSLYEGMRYQRDRALTIWRAGMGIVSRQVTDFIRSKVRDANVSRVDRGLRDAAGIAPNIAKQIEVAPGVYADVTEVYDAALDELAARISDEVTTNYREAVTRVLLAGGGAYHLLNHLRVRLPFEGVEIVPDAELANVLGSYSALALKLGNKK